MVDKAIFLKGSGLTKQEELKLHRIFKENLDTYKKSDEDLVPIIYTGPLPGKYGIAHSPGGIIQQLSLGDKLARLRTLKTETYKSLVKDKMLQYYAKVGKKISISEVSQAVATFKSVAKNLQDGAEKLTQYAFYFYMFFGVQNLFGLNTNFFGDSGLPYVPDVIIGTMPFYSAQRLERGMSDRALKYRAIGDVFLAHQRGSTDTLRLDMTLFGPYRGWYLLYLMSLQQAGESVLKELPLVSTGVKAPVEPMPSDIVNIPKHGKVQYESHTSFPIISQTAIMLDMYLQTIEWHQEKDKGGHDVIYVHLLFRKHIDPKGYTVFDEDDKVGYLNYGDTLDQRKRRELFLDTIWKCKELGAEVLKYGLFGGTSKEMIDREAVTSDPYITDISKLMAGYSFDINNMASIIPGLGG